MAILTETERLVIRNWIPQDDAEQAFEIYGDPEVMRFIGGGKEENVETQRRSLQQRTDRTAALNNGTGFWAIADKETGEIFGTVILKQLPDNDGNPTSEIEVGWHLKKAAWGKGYATEAGQAVLNYGFNVLKLPVIYAVVNPENTASIQVTQRLGMSPLGRTQQYYGKELELFKLEAPNP
ncbi:GNAT family N-acetyltransferase [Leptolyngbya sp. FACHB-671]|uniref:GNAT family N-acetyltransferase n=1 Tax=Leptolyngbya sp. FACHB-671 TaxID=2692812 RepID=UPI001686FAFE|nr:GNAT family N-acetyltransferase [Leptolyngbya sp. FACHB-671]MBD2071895.1 GNAT family N-acetyltransferase [Leptolyngbya sp. FACHB-671]